MRKILFSSSKDYDEQIFSIDWDGENRKQLTDKAKGISNRTTEWSPDGSRFAFQSNRDGMRSLYVMDYHSQRTSRLTDAEFGNASHPSWSPAGDKIAFTSNSGSGFKLFLVDVTGKSAEEIKLDKFNNLFNPCWVGEKIYFVGQEGGDKPENLWVVDLNSGSLTHLGPQGLPIFEFDVSPNDKKIVFDVKVDSSSILGNWDIYTMTTNGASVNRITDLEAMSSRPKFLSDGESIVFHSNRFSENITQPSENDSLEVWYEWWNQFELCVMDYDGKNVRRITNNQVRDLHPDG